MVYILSGFYFQATKRNDGNSDICDSNAFGDFLSPYLEPVGFLMTDNTAAVGIFHNSPESLYTKPWLHK